MSLGKRRDNLNFCREKALESFSGPQVGPAFRSEVNISVSLGRRLNFILNGNRSGSDESIDLLGWNIPFVMIIISLSSNCTGYAMPLLGYFVLDHWRSTGRLRLTSPAEFAPLHAEGASVSLNNEGLICLCGALLCPCLVSICSA